MVAAEDPDRLYAHAHVLRHAPATLAGNLVVTTVDAVSPLVLMQLVNPHPGLFCRRAHGDRPADRRLHGRRPRGFLLAAAFAEIRRFYQIPGHGCFCYRRQGARLAGSVDNCFSG